MHAKDQNKAALPKEGDIRRRRISQDRMLTADGIVRGEDSRNSDRYVDLDDQGGAPTIAAK